MWPLLLFVPDLLFDLTATIVVIVVRCSGSVVPPVRYGSIVPGDVGMLGIRAEKRVDRFTTSGILMVVIASEMEF